MTQEEIEWLITLEKRITKAPSKEFREDRMYYRKDFEAIGFNGERFSIFLRKHRLFQENFSVGLIFHPMNSGKILLIRMNGNHGESVKDNWKPIPHFNNHIHRITPEEVEAGTCNNPRFSEITPFYSTFEEAIRYFMQHTRILDAALHFPGLNQYSLPL